MYKKIILPLKNNPSLFYNEDKLADLALELEEFINDPSNSYMNERSFAEKFMGCQEIQSNNSIEGYNYDVSTIIKTIGNHHEFIELPEKREKIITNLYRGYQEILKAPDINKENLKQLYQILSGGLISEEDLKSMGAFYRMAPVYIYYSKIAWQEPDEGVPFTELEESMNTLFDYLNEKQDVNSQTDYFIKSQVAHYYLVHLHPYFDVNGRTSRTLGMWYLLNNKVYPYIIFNRAIPLTIKKYYKIIRDVNKFQNITFFLNYMMENVKLELEKEYVISGINTSIHGDLSESEYQTLLHILSMNGRKTLIDYATFYNRRNEKKKVVDIRDEVLLPLVDRDIIKIVRETNKSLSDGTSNYVFELNPTFIDNDPAKIKRLKIEQ